MKSFGDRIVRSEKQQQKKIDFMSTSTSRLQLFMALSSKANPDQQQKKKPPTLQCQCRCVKLFDKYSVQSTNKNIFINLDE